MKNIFTLLIVLIFPLTIFSKAQYGDILIINKDTCTFFSNPLELRHDIDSLYSKLFEYVNRQTRTICWMGCIAEWTLVGNEIYLTNIFDCDCKTKVDLKKIFPNEVKNGKIKANWITDNIYIPKGKILYEHGVFETIYEKEFVLTFEKGILKSQKEVDNSKTHISIFNEEDNLVDFIQKHINWAILPDLKGKRLTVVIGCQTGDSSKPDSIYIVNGVDNDLFNKEALRVVNLLPDWDVMYQHGEVHRIHRVLQIVFDDEWRKDANANKSLQSAELLNWKSKHLDISVYYSSPWAKRDSEIDNEDSLKVSFFNDQNGSELTFLIAPAPSDPYPESLMSQTPMIAVYDSILDAHSRNRNLQKSKEKEFHKRKYEWHPFEVYSEKWGIRKQDYFTKWIGKRFMIVIVTYKKENTNEMHEFITKNIRLFEN
jgi:hypothetical protein